MKVSIDTTIELIANDLAIEKSDMPVVSENDKGWQELRDLIVQRVLGWMEYDVDHLKYVLYRLDISEHKVKTVLANASFEEAAVGIADLILQREQEKAFTRQQYGTGKGEWLDV